MHRVLKSIRELLYLVRRSQGGVIKAERGGERHHRISSVPRPVILDADGSKMASLAEEAGRSLAVAENVTFCSVSMSSLSRRSDVKCLTGIAKIEQGTCFVFHRQKTFQHLDLTGKSIPEQCEGPRLLKTTKKRLDLFPRYAFGCSLAL